MTTRQQIARLLPLVLLLVLVVAGLRGAVPAPRWNGPLVTHAVTVGLALEGVLAVVLAVVLRRDRAARRARRPYRAEPDDPQPALVLRLALRYVLGIGLIAVAVALLSDLHLHFGGKPRPLATASPFQSSRPLPIPAASSKAGFSPHIPLGPILYGLLVAAVVAAVVISLWWSARRPRPAAPVPITGVTTEEKLREAVAEGRAALAVQDDARASIIACYVAMERSLAERGTARGAAGTPDELLARAVAAGTVRGGAAGRLTALFYEARFSSHPLSAGQRAAAAAALDELAAGLAVRAAPAADADADAAGRPAPPPPDRSR